METMDLNALGMMEVSFKVGTIQTHTGISFSYIEVTRYRKLKYIKDKIDLCYSLRSDLNSILNINLPKSNIYNSLLSNVPSKNELEFIAEVEEVSTVRPQDHLNYKKELQDLENQLESENIQSEVVNDQSLNVSNNLF